MRQSLFSESSIKSIKRFNHKTIFCAIYKDFLNISHLVWDCFIIFSEIYLQIHEVEYAEQLAAVLSSKNPTALLGPVFSDGSCSCMGSDFDRALSHKFSIFSLFEDVLNGALSSGPLNTVVGHPISFHLTQKKRRILQVGDKVRQR